MLTKRIVFLLLLALVALDVAAQQMRTLHKVQSKETVYGIARSYGLTLEEIIAANPEMSEPKYKLRKGDIINIPYPASKVKEDSAAVSAPDASAASKRRDDMTKRAIRVGVMLPLHDSTADGKRMVEYYRGVLMACDSLKQEGVSVDVFAWNVPEDGDITAALSDENAALCDLIIGPLYSKHMAALSAFVAENDIKLLVPFSINAPQLAVNNHIYQVYRNPDDYNHAVVAHFVDRFKDCRTVLIDCGDAKSTKGAFTAALRSQLEALGRELKITSLKTPEDQFVKAFSKDVPNVVVLNTSRASDLNIALAKLKNVVLVGDVPADEAAYGDAEPAESPYKLSLFGYTEWLTYTGKTLADFYLFDTYVPSVFYYNAAAARTARIETKYRWNFHADMIQQQPRFAITGFDQAYFFIKGLKSYGSVFTGAKGTVDYSPVQTPLHFEQIDGGGYKNGALMFIHYTTDKRVETIRY